MWLKIENIHVYYGESHIIQGVSLEIKDNEVVSLLGRNGMGKTTLLRSIIGHNPPKEGEILLNNTDITKMPPHQRFKSGIAYVPQGREIFPYFTVLENLKIGLLGKNLTAEIPAEIYEYFPILEEREKQKGGLLSGGEQQQLAIARGLLGNPELMLLDEPTEGLQPSIVEEIKEILKRIAKEKKISMLLVEQHLDFTKALSDRYYIMERGTIVNNGKINDLDDEIVNKYLAV